MAEKKDKYESAKNVPSVTFHPGSGIGINNKVAWYAVQIGGKVIDHFKKLILEQIINDPFYGIYRLQEGPPPDINIVYIYMKNSKQVHDLLGSPKMGACTVKYEIGGTEVLPTTAISNKEMERAMQWLTYAYGSSRELIKKCFGYNEKKAYKEEAVVAVQQINEEQIKLIEYANAIIRSLSITTHDENNNTWNFSIDIGYVYGLISVAELQAVQEVTANNIDFLIDPTVQTIGKSFENLEDTTDLVNSEKLLGYAKAVEIFADSYVKDKFMNYQVDRIARALLNKYSSEGQEPVETISEKKKITEPVVIEELEGDLRKTIKYKIEDYNIIFVKNGIIKLEVILSIDGKPEIASKTLEKETMRDLITDEGLNRIVDTIVEEVNEYFNVAPLRGSIYAVPQDPDEITPEEQLIEKLNNGK